MGAMAGEYASLRESAGILGPGGRALVRVWGERARQMVAGLVTSDVAGLESDRALYAFMLTPKGRPVAEMRVVALSPRELWLDLPEACAEGTLEHLTRYLPPMYARHAPLEDRIRLSVIGPSWARVAAALPGAADPDTLQSMAPLQGARLAAAGATGAGAGEDRPALPGSEDLLVRREPIEGPGADVYVARDRAGSLRDALVEAAREAGGGDVGAEAHDAWRVERGIPVYGREIDLEVLPQETGQTERAVDFEKGCYTGQEVVARIHYRGHVNRRLVGLRFTPPEGGDPGGGGRELLPAAGGGLFQGERERGRITSSVRSPRLGPIGLGYVRREVETGARLALEAGGAARAEVVDLPFPGAGF